MGVIDEGRLLVSKTGTGNGGHSQGNLPPDGISSTRSSNHLLSQPVHDLRRSRPTLNRRSSDSHPLLDDQAVYSELSDHDTNAVSPLHVLTLI